MKIKYIIALLLLLMFVLGFASALFKSRTSDEVTYHLNGGYHFLKTGEWIAPIDNPPLSGILVSIPLLFVDKGRFRNFERLSIEDYVNERNISQKYSAYFKNSAFDVYGSFGLFCFPLGKGFVWNKSRIVCIALIRFFIQYAGLWKVCDNRHRLCIVYVFVIVHFLEICKGAK